MRAPYPSRAYLPKLEPAPATILEHLVERFPSVSRDVWIDRMERGLVLTASGRRITPRSPYAHGLTVLYYRESDEEPIVPFEESIIYRDERILVVDKPHFLPVVPGGAFADECLLARVQRSTGLSDLAPMHRLDRDTAGLVLFVAQSELRPLYHRMFADNAVRKEYLAVAHITREPDTTTFRAESRIVTGEPWYRMKVVDGPPNAATEIALLDRHGDRGLFRLVPESGKKHQLRVQMAALGFPIVNDRLYPEVVAPSVDDYERPLQLLARLLAWRDPVTGADMTFESRFTVTL